MLQEYQQITHAPYQLLLSIFGVVSQIRIAQSIHYISRRGSLTKTLIVVDGK